MQICFVWSGLTSKAVALNLRWFLEAQRGLPEFSIVSQGSREPLVPTGGVAMEREPYRVVLCLTPDNVDDLWLAYRAGRWEAQLPEGHLVTLRFGVEKEQIAGPLSRLASYAFTASGLREFMGMPTCAEGEPAETDELDIAWPAFEGELDRFLGVLRHGEPIGNSADAADSPVEACAHGRDQHREALRAILGERSADIVLSGASYREQKQLTELALKADVISRALRATHGNTTRAAALLELHRARICMLAKETNLRPQDFRDSEVPPEPDQPQD